jgi:hypothetical protein
MTFSYTTKIRTLLFLVVMVILLGHLPLISTIGNPEYRQEVLPFLWGLIVLCLGIGLFNQFVTKKGHLVAIAWILNPASWCLYGIGALWYARFFEFDWLWWLIYPGLYCIFFFLQVVFSKWWQAHDHLIIKISLWTMTIPPALFGGRYARYKFRLMESQGTMPYYNSLSLADWAMLLAFTMVGIGSMIALGRNLWQKAQQYEAGKRETENG